MKIAPLIHSRTFEVDFNSKFAVRPDDFTNSDIEWAMKVILPSTQALDILNDVRFVAASQGGKCIAGVACILKHFADKNNLPTEAEEFFCDNRGRFIKVFLGYSIKDASPNKIPDVKPADLWQMFKEYLAPEWKRKAPETVLAPYRDCVAKTLIPNLPKPAQSFQGVGLYEMNSAANEKLFETYLAFALKQNLAFCTNLDRVQPIEDKIYHAVTTTANIIERLKEKQRQLAEAAKKKYELEHRRASSERAYVDTSELWKDKEFVPVEECLRRLDSVVANLVVVDNDVKFEPKNFEFGKYMKRFICEMKKIG